ncbi:MAG TPA: proprotein convertase P-domain-containing protein [Phycisphaerae bacterium]|nr:proprotein convertase P-domain-containing protein [Phycisphaerae bacterium]
MKKGFEVGLARAVVALTLAVVVIGGLVTPDSVLAGAAPPPPPGCPSLLTSFNNNNMAAVGDNQTIMSVITVSGVDPEIWDVDVVTTIAHLTNDDLDITLTSPAGTVVTLTTDNGGNSNDNVFNGTFWDDDGGDSNAPGPATDNGYVDTVVATPLVPEEAMSAFVGENPNGDWTLTVTDDNTNGFSGTLTSWSLNVYTIPGAPTNTQSTVTNNTGMAIADNSTIMSDIVVSGLDTFLCDVNMRTFITHTSYDDLDITLESPTGTIVTISTDNGGTSNDSVFDGTIWDDSAGDTNPPGPVTDTGFADGAVETTLVPEEAMGAFVGEDPNGTWTLTITDDNTNAQPGNLSSWSLILNTCRQPDADVDATGDACDTCTDTDGDGRGNPGFAANTCPVDNCPTVANAGQGDTDGDGDGNACDSCPNDAENDADGDGDCGNVDNCPTVSNSGQEDGDGDGKGDACDNCPGAFNADQTDGDGDGKGDACDNCPMTFNADQADSDNDGIGDACETSGPPPAGGGCCAPGVFPVAGLFLPACLIGWRLRRWRRLGTGR